MTGTVRYALNLAAALVDQGITITWGRTVDLPLPDALRDALPALADRLDTFFTTYPIGLSAPPARVLHLTVESLATALMTTRWRGPVVLTVHDVISYLTRRDAALRAYAHPIHELFDVLSLRLFRRADALIADSAWTAEAVARHTGYPRERIRVVPLGVDHARFRPEGPTHPVVESAAQGGPIVGFVGALKARKNLSALVRAMPAIRARTPAARLLVAGSAGPAEIAELAALTAELGVSDAVVSLGTIPDEAVPALYRRAAVVVVPSLYEGFGLPALEAMACGAPVVAAARASLPEVVADAGILCAPEPDAIAEGVSRLLTDEPQRAGLAAAGLERARGFTWARTASATRAVYAEAQERRATMGARA